MELEEHTDSGISRLYLEENYGLAHDQMVTSAASFVAKYYVTHHGNKIIPAWRTVSNKLL